MGREGQIAKEILPLPPKSSSESVNVLMHYYRGELSRALSWRDRIDRTTNWAITVVAAMFSISLSTPTTHHGILIMAMVLVLLMWAIEARRYRFYDVYRNRVRRLERHYIAAALTPDTAPDPEWCVAMAEELRHSRLEISFNHAMTRRLRRNYIWIFLVLLLAWLFKTTSGKLPNGADSINFVHSAADWIRSLALGPIPGLFVLMGLVAFYVWLGFCLLRKQHITGEFAAEETQV